MTCCGCVSLIVCFSGARNKWINCVVLRVTHIHITLDSIVSQLKGSFYMDIRWRRCVNEYSWKATRGSWHTADRARTVKQRAGGWGTITKWTKIEDKIQLIIKLTINLFTRQSSRRASLQISDSVGALAHRDRDEASPTEWIHIYCFIGLLKREIIYEKKRLFFSISFWFSVKVIVDWPQFVSIYERISHYIIADRTLWWTFHSSQLSLRSSDLLFGLRRFEVVWGLFGMMRRLLVYPVDIHTPSVTYQMCTWCLLFFPKDYFRSSCNSHLHSRA